MTKVKNVVESMERAHQEMGSTPCLDAMKRQGLVGLDDTGFAPERQIITLFGTCTPKYCFR
jgi:hypothetical protein